jgi:hypothetical protein
MRPERASVLPSKARPLEAEPPQPADDPLVPGRVRVPQQEADSEGVLQIDCGSSAAAARTSVRFGWQGRDGSGQRTQP